MMYLMRKNLFLILLFNSIILFAQEKYYSPPLKIPLVLSAGFAELRTNHFHSGIDIKTQGVTGIPVYSVADGFISRISVSPTGFGYALYIDHYNGTTSVYGHLQEFREDIQQYIQDFQYLQKSFKVDVPVSPEQFLVQRGEIIAKSGNTGSSGGPHLHFEIRDTKTEEPLNPLQFGFSVSDKTKPKITALQLTTLSKNGHVDYKPGKRKYQVVLYDGKYHVKNNPIIPVYGEVGFALEVNDYFDYSYNKCGINKMTLKIDGTDYFSVDLNRFSFDQTRYINSYIDYDEFMNNRRRYQKTWIEPGNKLKNYVNVKNNGIKNFDDRNIHQVEIEVKDAYENTSILTFSVESVYRDIESTTNDFVEWFEYDKTNNYNTSNFQLEIPEGALYSSFGFHHKTRPGFNDLFTEIHEIDYNTTPLHKSAMVSIKTTEIDERLQEKALLVIIDNETGKYWPAGGTIENGWIKSEIRVFGDYAVTIDTIPPIIKPLSISGKNSLTESNRIRFIVTDELSGIKNIAGTIDGKWALFEYDAKNNLITHNFDSERFEMKKRHDFKLKVSDYKNNVSSYEATFWK